MNTTRMSSRRAVLSVFMAVVLAVGMMPLPAYAAPTQPSDSGTQLQAAQLPDSLTEGGASELTAQDADDDSDFVDFATDLADSTRGGDANHPYRIKTEVDLIAFRAAINNDTHPSYGAETGTYAGKYFKLIDDIELSDAAWVPIGNASGKYFAGIFDGGGHTVSNLHFEATGSSGAYCGFFGYVKALSGPTIEIKNLKIVGASSQPADIVDGTTSTSSAVGGIAAYVNPSTNATSGSTSVPVKITNCVTDVSLKGGRNVGGIAGYANTNVDVSDCLVLGSITMEAKGTNAASYGGGIVGVYNTTSTQPTVSNNLFLGQINTTDATMNTAASNNAAENFRYSCNALVGRFTLASATADTALDNISNNHYVAQTDGRVQAYRASVSGDTAATEPTEGMVVSKPTTAAEKAALVTTMGWDSTNNALLIASLPPADSGDGGDTGDDEDEGPSIEAYDPTAAEPSAEDIAQANVTYLPEKTVTAGTSITLSIHATPKNSSNTLTYQWFKTTAPEDDDDSDMIGQSLSAQEATADTTYGGEAIDGETNATLTVTPESTAAYYCAVTETDSDTSTTSTSYSPLAVITVQEVIPAATDTFLTDLADSSCGTEENPYCISTATDMADLAAVVNGTERSDKTTANADSLSGKYIQLQNDIELSGEWTPIGTSSNYFEGVFDGGSEGDAHIISGLSVTGAVNLAGLFGYIYNATIKNLIVQGTVSRTGESTVYANVYVGGVVGYAYGSTLENVGNEATVTNTIPYNSSYTSATAGVCAASISSNKVTLTRCYNKGAVTGRYYTAGICAYYAGTVTSCYNLGALESTASYYVGGISGASTSAIYNCYNDSTLTRGSSGTYWGAITSATGVTYDASSRSNYYNSDKASQGNGSATQQAANVGLPTSDMTDTLLGNLNAGSADTWKDGADINGDFDGTPALAWEPAVDDPTQPHYDVTFNSNGGSEVPTQSVQEGKKAKKPTDPTKDGYVFDGWYSDEELTTVYSFDTAVSAAITLYANWADAVTVTFDTGEGGPAIDSQVIKKGTTATQPSDPSRTNYEFGGWYTDNEYTTEFDFSTAININTTVFAKLTKLEVYEYQIEPATTLEAGEEYFIAISTLTGAGKEGRILSTNNNASSTSFDNSNQNYRTAKLYTGEDGNLYISDSSSPTTETLLSARWLAESNSSEGFNLSNTSDQTGNEKRWLYCPSNNYALSINTTEPEHGWTCTAKTEGSSTSTVYLRNANKTNTAYSIELTSSYIDMDSNKEVLLYKYVDPTATRYTVTFNSNGGSSVASQAVKAGNTASKPADPAKDNCTFKGWYSDSGLQNTYDFTTPVNGEITLYAKWVDNVTVTFNSNGGSDVASQSIEPGTKASKPATPTKEGYGFAGWYSDEELENAFDFESTNVSENITLYAKWAQTTTFVVGTGTESDYDNPYANYNQNSTVEMIYPADEINEVGSIVSISFQVDEASSFSTSSVKVYMGYTELDAFGSASDYIALTDAALVYEGAPTLGTATGWEQLVLDNAFNYDSENGNLVIAVTHQSSSYNAGLLYRYTNANNTVLRRGNGSWYTTYSDISNTSNLSLSNERPNIKLDIVPSDDTRYTVTYHTNGGTAIDVAKVIAGRKAKAPEDPTKDNYVFKGWYSDESLQTSYDFASPVTSNLDLYAKWADAVTVTFDTGEGGPAVASQLIETGTTASRPTPDPTWMGHEFVNWYADDAYDTPFDFEQTISTGTTVYAKWKVIPVVEVTIGEGTTTNGINAPWVPYYYYTLSEMIYESSDIGTAGTINDISFHLYAASQDLEAEYLKIYMGHYTGNAFASSSGNSFKNSDDFQLVYSGAPTVNSASTGWQTFSFDEGFSYNGTDDLIVLVITNFKNEASGVPKVYGTTTESRYVGQYNTDSGTKYADLASVQGSSQTLSASTYRPDIKLTINTHKHVISGEPTFTWADDNESCTVSFTCMAEGCSGEDKGNDTYKVTENATVTSEVTKEATCSATGSKTYTATYTLNGTEYIDTKTVELPIDPDNHNVTEWTVSADGTTKSGVCSWCGQTITVPNASVWDGETATAFEGSGDEADPYLIASAANLAYLAQQVNAGTSYSGDYFEQTIDINLDDNEWTPVGNSSKSFSGFYDGGEHTVSGLKISSATSGYQGLFGYVKGTSASSRSKVSNLIVDGSVSVGAYNYIGGVVGRADYTDFENVGNKADVYVSGGSSSGYFVGGVTGYAYYDGNYTNCYNKGDVSGLGSPTWNQETYGVGGIVGYSNYAARTLQNCYNLGNVTGGTGVSVGGIVGCTGSQSYSDTLKNCYNTGTISGGYKSGGLFGYGYTGISISNNYYLSQSGLAANGRSETDTSYATPKTADDMKASTFPASLSSAYASGSKLSPAQEYPILSWEAPAKAPVIEPYNSSATPTDEQIAGAQVTYLPSATLQKGETIKLSVKATADGTMTYQWYTTSVPTSQSGQSVASMVAGAVGDLAAQADSTDPYGGTAIEGATAATYTVTADESAAYYCAVTSNGKTAYSTRAVITVEEETDPDNTFKASDEAPVITTQADLDAFAAAVNGGNSFSGKTVSIAENAADGLQVTSRIGSASNPFSGTFDGNGYKLNVLITGTDRQGLFGALIGTTSNPATVKNLIITGAVTTTAVDDNHNGRVGAVTPVVAGVAVIQNVGNEAEVEAMGEGAYYAGGLVGYVTSHPDDWSIDGDLTIMSCYNRGSVTATGQYAGGLVGYSDGYSKVSITNSYVNAAVSAGEYAGGFFGDYEGANYYNDYSGAVSNSYRAGTVAGSKAGAMVGGLAGSITFTDVYNDSTDEAKHTGDGDDKNGVTNKSAADLKGLAATLGASFKADATDAEKMINAGFPVLSWEDVTTPQATVHNITVATGIEGGTVVAKPSHAAAGGSVAVMVTPDSTHTVGTVTYKLAGGDATEIEADGGTYTFTMPDANVEVSATFVEKTAHDVTVTAGDHGTASASPTSAVEGQTVTVTAVPASGYQVDEMTATDGESNAVSIEVDGNEGTFTMPDSAVTVSVAFKEYKPLRLAIAKDTTTYTPKASLLTGEQTQVGVSLHAYIDDAEVTQEAQIENLKLNWYAKGSETPDSSVTPEFNTIMIGYGVKTNTLKTTSFNFSKDAAGTYTYCAKATWTYTIDGTEYSAESDVLEWEFTVTEPVDLTQALKAGSDLEITSADSTKWAVNDTEEGRSYIEAAKDNVGSSVTVEVPSAGWLLWDWKLGDFEKKAYPQTRIQATTDTGDNLFPFTDLASNSDASGDWSRAVVYVSKAGTVTFTFNVQNNGANNTTNTACIDNVNFVTELTPVAAGGDEHVTASVKVDDKVVTKVDPRQGAYTNTYTFTNKNEDADVTAAGNKKVTWTAEGKDGYVIVGWKANLNDDEFVAEAATYEAVPYDEAITLYAVSGLPFEGAGTEADPFQIKTMSDLEKLSSIVGGGETFSGKYLKLLNDIDAEGASFAGVGDSSHVFRGTFDGDGKEIKNVKLAQGLFGRVAEGGVVKNLTVAAEMEPAANNAGIVTAELYGGTVQNVSVSGTVAAGSREYVGGIVGRMMSSTSAIESCSSAAVITGEHGSTAQRLGGIAGTAYGTVSGCTFGGSITATGGNYIGGIAGSIENASTVSGCVVTGNVTGASSTDVGGIVGCFSSNQSKVENCEVYNAAIFGANEVGGIVGYLKSGYNNTVGTVNACLASGTVAASSGAAGGIVGKGDQGSTVSNCVALQNSVSGETAARVFGVAGGSGTQLTPSGNYAWAGMKVGESGSEAAVAADGEDVAADKKQGASVKTAELLSETVPAAFTALTGWTKAAGAKPAITGNSDSGTTYPDYIRNLTVTFDDGTNKTTQTVVYGEKATKPTDPERAGYKFVNWHAVGTDDAFNFDTAVKDDLTLVAKWEIDPASVTRTLTVVVSGLADATAAVSVVDSEGAHISPATSGNGTYTYKIGAGAYTVSASAEGYAKPADQTVAASESTDGVTVEFKSWTPDASALDAAITAAQALYGQAKDGAKSADDVAAMAPGEEYYEKDKVDALAAAIASATEAKDSAETATAVKQAVDALQDAAAAVEKKTVSQPDKSALADAIEAAEAAIDGVTGSTPAGASLLPDGTKWADAVALAAYRAAIEAAEAVLASDSASAADVAAAEAALAEPPAVSTVSVDRSALESAIEAADADLSGTEVASSAADVDEGEAFATQAQADALAAAIAKAEAARAKASASQAEVDAARAELAAAQAAFDAAKGTGTKKSETPEEPETPAEKADGVVRLWGETALDTMAAIVEAGNYEAGGVVVLTTIDGYWDALTAAGAAGLAGAPVLMTDGGSLSAQTEAIIRGLKPSTVIVCGGPAAVSDEAASQALAAAARGAKLERFYGETAVGTACAIYERAPRAAGGEWASTAIVATNGGYWDALAAAPLSYALHMPIFLTDGADSISSEALAAMAAGGVTEAYIAGGEAAVSPAVEAQLRAAGIRVAGRLAGETAIETSEAVAQFGLDNGMTCDSMGVATNSGYWDALAGAALCGRLNSVLVLAGSASDGSVASGGFVDAHASGIDGLYIFGGAAAVDPSIESALKSQVD